MHFAFADHAIDTERRELRRGSELVAVEPQVFDVLVYLIENRDHVVSKDDLLAAVWDSRAVSDSTLTSRINAARRAVGDDGSKQRLIRTVARRGFRFVGAVHARFGGGRSPDAARPRSGESREQSHPGSPPADRPAIAVLPFVNLSGDPEQEYF